MVQHSFKNDLQKLNLLKTAGFEKEFAWRAKTLTIDNIYPVRTGKQKTSVMLTSDSTSTPKEVHKLGVDAATWLWGRGKISQLNKPPYKHPEHQMKYKELEENNPRNMTNGSLEWGVKRYTEFRISQLHVFFFEDSRLWKRIRVESKNANYCQHIHSADRKAKDLCNAN